MSVDGKQCSNKGESAGGTKAGSSVSQSLSSAQAVRGHNVGSTMPAYGTPVKGSLWLKGITFLFVILALFLLTKILWSIFSPLPVPTKPPTIAPNLSSQSGNEDQLVSIKEKNPFAISGADFIDIVENPQTNQNVKETTLDLKLHGVRIDNKKSSAIIDVGGNGGQKVFKIGDTITPGVELSEILAGEIIISRAGVRESLRLEGKEEENQNNQANSGNRLGVNRASTNQSLRSASAPNANDAILGTDQKEAQSQNAPTKKINIRDFIQVRRRRNADGQFALFLQPGRNRDGFAEAGLIPNDMLINVNGAPAPQNLRALYDMMNTISVGGSVSMIVERDGIPKQININSNQFVVPTASSSIDEN